MTKLAGMGDRLAVDGFDVSGSIGSLSNIHGGLAALDVTDITQAGPARLGGERDASIEFSAWLEDTAVTGGHAVLSALPTGQRVVTYSRGTAFGSFAASMVARQINYDPNRGTDSSLTLAVSTQADGSGLEWTDLLTPWPRTDTTATNGASQDFGAVSTLFGAQAYLQVFSVTGTSITVKLQDSADNATFADISGAAFTAATARGAQRLALANNATIRRYVRVATTGTFSNAQFVCCFNRNLTLTAF
jgi:hypothetical protein